MGTRNRRPETDSQRVSYFQDLGQHRLSASLKMDRPGRSLVCFLFSRREVRGTDDMNRRQNRRKVLDLEVQRWSSVPCNRLLYELSDVKVYEVEYGSKTYQVEVEILENTAKYVRQSTGI